MYAIVDISGKQFKVEKNKYIYTDKIDPKSGKKVEFDNVLFISDKGKAKIGKPVIKGSKVTGEILDQVKDDKVLVFKKKRRKGYKVKNGHRQQMTEIIIEKVNEKSAAKAKVATKSKEEKPKAKAKTNSKTKKSYSKKGKHVDIQIFDSSDMKAAMKELKKLQEDFRKEIED